MAITETTAYRTTRGTLYSTEKHAKQHDIIERGEELFVDIIKASALKDKSFKFNEAGSEFVEIRDALPGALWTEAIRTKIRELLDDIDSYRGISTVPEPVE